MASSIDDIESSVEQLLADRARRQRWQQFLHFFGCIQTSDPVDDQDRVPNNTSIAAWRSGLAGILESSPVHLITVLLLLLDLTISVLDMSSSLASCSKASKKETNESYHLGGIIILCLLLARILALVVALGVSFFRRPGHVVDGLVVAVALVLELIGDGAGAGLILVVSLWRLLRLVETALELSTESIDAKIEKIIDQLDELRDENKKLEEAVADKEETIKKLEEERRPLNSDLSQD